MAVVVDGRDSRLCTAAVGCAAAPRTLRIVAAATTADAAAAADVMPK
jgi:hypothetical protein